LTLVAISAPGPYIHLPAVGLFYLGNSYLYASSLACTYRAYYL